jgi:hypothetical protein
VLIKHTGPQFARRASMLEDLQGMAMWWFNKGERKEVWDEEIQWPIGDIQAAHKIRDTAVPPPTVRRKLAALPTAQTKTNPISNYERAAKAAMQIAIPPNQLNDLRHSTKFARLSRSMTPIDQTLWTRRAHQAQI